MDKMLKSLEEHNEGRRQKHVPRGQQLNGIACPKCGAELADTDPTTCLTSDPPQTATNCPNCNYRGYRIV